MITRSSRSRSPCWVAYIKKKEKTKPRDYQSFQRVHVVPERVVPRRLSCSKFKTSLLITSLNFTLAFNFKANHSRTVTAHNAPPYTILSDAFSRFLSVRACVFTRATSASQAVRGIETTRDWNMRDRVNTSERRSLCQEETKAGIKWPPMGVEADKERTD